jgi:hypothetical protein
MESKNREHVFDPDRGAERAMIEAHRYPPISAAGLLA